MPIDPIILQRRHTELGRIRLGDKGDRGQPQKLTKFRFTSPSERHIRDLATLYGGEAKAWDNKGKQEFECYSTASSIPVIVVKGGLTQWMETWSGGGCIHRCDGVINAATGEACDPDEFIMVTRKGAQERLYVHRDAKPTTRFSAMLPELEAIGVWRTETHGWNAGAELPPMVDLAMHLGDLVPARLMLAERITVKDGKTNRFVVPTLDLGISAARLTAIANGSQPAAIAAPELKAIDPVAGPVSSAVISQSIRECETPDAVRDLWRSLGESGQLTDEIKAALTVRANEVKPIDATIDDEPDEDAAWAALVAQAGAQGMSMPDLEKLLAERYPEGAGGPDFVELTRFLKTGEVAA